MKKIRCPKCGKHFTPTKEDWLVKDTICPSCDAWVYIGNQEPKALEF